MLKEINEDGEKIRLRINRKKTQFVKSQWCNHENIRSRYETRASGHARMIPPPWTTIARRRHEWKMCWGPHNL
ncbi:hypothetical protein KIN20_027340 [Parelaphostrongylus tenuis]|uniref:Uncharacterized protein n=1 Tax=Parelaphostrongylus tenuis TaxID=148309 RepID=A0AAD5QZL3_PARTN|nr:hypothetical protein KIN20_027340 [Parelaphostrongylus tenuis]